MACGALLRWTLTYQIPITPLVPPLMSLGCEWLYMTGRATLMAGGQLHESKPFEARQVHEERQGPHI